MEVHDPGAVQVDPRAQGLRLTVLSDDEDLITIPFRWSGERLGLDVSLELQRLEWGSGLRFALRNSADEMEIYLSGWGGGTILERGIGCGASFVEASLPEGRVREAVLKACANGPRYATAYAFEGAARTSNAVDRLMNYQDRLLYAQRYFHGTTASAKLSMRAMATLWNFHPYGARVRRADDTRSSPFADVNGFQYHDNWLENFLIASSRGGRSH